MPSESDRNVEMKGNKANHNSILAVSNDSNSNRSDSFSPSLDNTERQEQAEPSKSHSWESDGWDSNYSSLKTN